jgi:hypothetical protein
MEQMGANCLQMSALRGIYEGFGDFLWQVIGHPEVICVTRQIQTTHF